MSFPKRPEKNSGMRNTEHGETERRKRGAGAKNRHIGGGDRDLLQLSPGDPRSNHPRYPCAERASASICFKSFQIVLSEMLML